jgi:hypothetical protein
LHPFIDGPLIDGVLAVVACVAVWVAEGALARVVVE